MSKNRKQLLSDQQAAVALSELHLRGDVEFSESGEEWRLTSKGIDYAWEIWERFTETEKVALFGLIDAIAQAVEDGRA